MRFHDLARRILIAPALGLALGAAMTACSSGSSPAATPPATTSSPTAAGTSPSGSATAGGGSGAATSQITANWEAFFSSSTPDSKRVELLQNGQRFAAAVTAFSKSPLASAVSAKVDSVTMTSATQAKVKYDLTAAGTSVASGATGVAVLENGVWKVGDASFCGLLQQGSTILNIPVPSACKSAG
jgi:hypothetical protein